MEKKSRCKFYFPPVCFIDGCCLMCSVASRRSSYRRDGPRHLCRFSKHVALSRLKQHRLWISEMNNAETNSLVEMSKRSLAVSGKKSEGTVGADNKRVYFK